MLLIGALAQGCYHKTYLIIELAKEVDGKFSVDWAVDIETEALAPTRVGAFLWLSLICLLLESDSDVGTYSFLYVEFSNLSANGAATTVALAEYRRST